LKVLFITYYWPPAGGVSVQRILHFVNNLSALGVSCHVIYPENASYYQTDQTLKKQINSSIILHPVPIKDLTSLIKKLPGQAKEGNIKKSSKSFFSRLLKNVRANYFIPDPKINWVNPVVAKGRKIIETEHIDLIFTNGTPHSVHLAGMGLVNLTKLPWIADFRDPWTRMDNFKYFPLNKSALKKHQTLERKVIESANLTLTVSPSWADDFTELGARNSAHITNGFDEIIESIDSPEFIVSHVGSIHSDRDLNTFIDAFAKVAKSSNKSTRPWKLALVGNVDSSSLSYAKEKLNSDQLIVTGLVNHEAAKNWIARSSALLLPINKSIASKGRIPAKLFEYLSSGKPIILLGNKLGDAAKILQKCNAGKAFDPDDRKGMEAYLTAVAEGQYKYDNNSEAIQQYSRRHTAIQLHSKIKKLIDSNA